MSRKYPFLVAGLPELTGDLDAGSFNLPALKEEVETLLSEKDAEALRWLCYPFDNHNLICLLQGKDTFSPLGSIPPEELRARLEDMSDLPAYMTEFLESYTGKDLSRPERIESAHPEDDLADDFHRAAAEHPVRFIRDWFAFDLEWRNVIAAIVARRHRLQQQTLGEGDVADALRTATAADFGLKQQRTWIEPLLQIMDMPDIVQRELKLDLLQWEELDTMAAMHDFDTVTVLAWMQKAIMVQRRMLWNAEAGRELFRRWVEGTQASFDLKQVLTS